MLRCLSCLRPGLNGHIVLPPHRSSAGQRVLHTHLSGRVLGASGAETLQKPPPPHHPTPPAPPTVDKLWTVDKFLLETLARLALKVAFRDWAAIPGVKFHICERGGWGGAHAGCARACKRRSEVNYL